MSQICGVSNIVSGKKWAILPSFLPTKLQDWAKFSFSWSNGVNKFIDKNEKYYPILFISTFFETWIIQAEFVSTHLQ